MRSKFKFYEIVKISSRKKAYKPINGQVGVIRGKIYHKSMQKWLYTVHIIGGEVWATEESQLRKTGLSVTQEEYFKMNKQAGRAYFNTPKASVTI